MMVTRRSGLGLMVAIGFSLLLGPAHAALFVDADVEYAGLNQAPDRVTADFSYDDDDADTADYFYEWVLSSTRLAGGDSGFVESFFNSQVDWFPIDSRSSTVVDELFPTPGTYEFTVSFTSFYYSPPDRCVGGPDPEDAADDCVPTYTDGASDTLLVSYGAPQPSEVPEPGVLSLLSLGVAGLLLGRKRDAAASAHLGDRI